MSRPGDGSRRAPPLSPVTLVVVASGMLVAGHLLPGLDGTLVEFGMRDSLHVIVFAGFGLALFDCLCRFGTGIAVVVTLIAIGIIGFTAELVQSTRGSEPDLLDVYRDLAGGALGIMAWLCLRGARSGRSSAVRRKLLRAGATLAVLLVFAPLAYWGIVAALNFLSAPRLVGFDHWWERHTIWAVNTRIERVPVRAAGDRVSGLAGHLALSPDRRAGISVFPGFSDWSGHEYLEFTLAVVDGADVGLQLRLNDGERFRRYDGAFTHSITATAEPVRLRLRLADLAADPDAGMLDLSDIRQMTLLAARAPAGTILMLDEFRLH